MSRLTVEYIHEVRLKLEEKYTHVTFVKTEKHPVYGERIYWTVGEDMTSLITEDHYKVDELFAEIELKKLKLSTRGNLSSEKVWLFFHLMADGKLDCDWKLYKKYTEKQLEEMYRRDKK